MSSNRITAAARDRRRTHLPWLTVLVFFLSATSVSAADPGTWAPLGDMPSVRAGHTATLLRDGKVLIAGGKDGAGQALVSGELFDPATGSYLAVGSMPHAVWGHTATLLQDGTVLIAGGKDTAGQPVAAAQLFDPSSATFSALPAMASPRAHHAASALGDGRVLLAGGTDGANPVGSLEVYDPAARAFSSVGRLSAPRQDHTATVLADGRVLVAGGSDGVAVVGSGELFDPKTGAVAPAGALAIARALASAARLPDGKVLVAGGQGTDGQDLNSAEVYDPAQNAFALSPAQMSTARSGHLGLLLENSGKVLIAGGTSASQLLASVEIYDAILGAFWQPASPSAARQLFGANFFLAPYTGMLLISGGLDGNSAALASSEAFTYPTIRSDKPDYQPGETVTLMGERWLPNEIVSINVHESNSDPDINFGVITDASGAFTVNAFEVNQGDLSQSFIATASGEASRWTAQMRFTDSVSSVTITSPTSGSPQTITSLPATITVSFNYSTSSTGATTATVDILGTTLSNSKTVTPGLGRSDSITVTVPAGTASGTYNVKVTVANSTGGGSNQKNDVQNGALIINLCTPPSVTNNPTDQTVVYGQNASFSAAAVGNPTPTVQWQVSTDGGISWTNLPSATSTTLTVTAVTVAQSGNTYRAVFANSCGAANAASATLMVNKATPTIAWNNPADITYGTALSGTQLNASANVPGSFSYTPAAGALLNAGPNQSLHADFTPADPVNYNPASKDVKINVLKAPLTVKADSASKVYGAALPAFTASYAGFVLGEGPGVLGGTLTFTTSATASSPVGSYAVTPGGLTSGNYEIAFASGTLSVTPAPLTVKADDRTKILMAPLPSFTATYTGFVLGEGPGVLGGSLTFTTSATASSPVGSYPVTPGGLTSGNYAITFIQGTLSILYASSGTCLGSPGHQILQPIDAAGGSVFKQKSTVPAKFRVCDYYGNSVGTAGVVTSFRLIQTISGTAADVDQVVDSTTPDTAFRWDPTDQQWIFNMSTRNLSAAVTYVYRITLNDGSTIDFRFGLK